MLDVFWGDRHSRGGGNPVKDKPPGVARQLVTFFCFAKKKVIKETPPRFAAPFGGTLDQPQASGAAQLDLAGRTPRAPLRDSNSARPNLRSLATDRGGAQGMETIFKILNRRVGTMCPPQITYVVKIYFLTDWLQYGCIS